jgi:hypothetical protein
VARDVVSANHRLHDGLSAELVREERVDGSGLQVGGRGGCCGVRVVNACVLLRFLTAAAGEAYQGPIKQALPLLPLNGKQQKDHTNVQANAVT